MVMVYFDLQRKIKLKIDAGLGGMVVIMKQYDLEVKRWRLVIYRFRVFIDIESRYLQLEKEVKVVEWGIFVNQIYLYGMVDVFEVDIDYKSLVSLFLGYRIIVLFSIERMRVCFLGFNYRFNYVFGKEGLENNEVDYFLY